MSFAFYFWYRVSLDLPVVLKCEGDLRMTIQKKNKYEKHDRTKSPTENIFLFFLFYFAFFS